MPRFLAMTLLEWPLTRSRRTSSSRGVSFLQTASLLDLDGGGPRAIIGSKSREITRSPAQTRWSDCTHSVNGQLMGKYTVSQGHVIVAHFQQIGLVCQDYNSTEARF